MSWNPSAGVEAYLCLKKLAARVFAGLEEGEVLAGEHVVEMITGGHERKSRLSYAGRQMHL